MCVSRHPGRAEDDGIDHRRRLCPVGAVLCRNAFHQLLQCNQSGAAATEIEFLPFINCHSATCVAPPRPKSNYDPRRRPVIARYLSPFRGFLAPKIRRQETNPVLILGRTFLAIRCPVHSVNRVVDQNSITKNSCNEQFYLFDFSGEFNVNRRSGRRTICAITVIAPRHAESKPQSTQYLPACAPSPTNVSTPSRRG